MNDDEIISSEEFIKFSEAVVTFLTFQLHNVSKSYELRNISIYDDLKDDWVIGYIFGWTNYLYQLSGFKDFENGFFYILYGIYSKWKISGLENYSEHKDFFLNIEKKIDNKNNTLFEGFVVGYKDIEHNHKRKERKDNGMKISLQRFLMKKIKTPKV